jgi:hypothetical protein
LLTAKLYRKIIGFIFVGFLGEGDVLSENQNGFFSSSPAA